MGLRKITCAVALLGAAMVCRPASAACNLGLIAELPLTRYGGDSTIQVKINGADAKLIVDTGAFFSLVTPAAAARLKMPPTTQEYDLRMVGVGGTTSRVSVRVAQDLNIAGAQLHNVDFELGETALGDADGLLGQNLLAFPEVEYDLGHDVMRLFKPNGCATEPLAYWATSQPYSVVDIDTHSRTELAHISGHVLINGVRLKVDFDTGTPQSIITLAAAAQAGVKPYDPGVYPAGETSGIAKNSEIHVWNAPFASFKLGDEEIKNVRLFVGPLGLGDSADMLLGADFFRTHRILVSYTQNKLYFSYAGGQVFAASSASNVDHAPGASDGAPLDAQGFDRKGWAEFARKDYDNAIADLTKAVTMDPTNPEYVSQRGQVYRAAQKPREAMADYDQSLKMKPDGIWTLLMRSSLHRANKELEAADADLATADRLATNKSAWGFAIGEAYSDADNYEKSIEWLSPWIAANPSHQQLHTALNTRCWSRAMLGRDLSQALADCTAGLKLMPGEPNLLAAGVSYVCGCGNFDGSIADYNAAIAAHPDVGWSFYGRAMAELNKGMISEGEDDERRAKRLEPDIAATAAKWGITRPSL